MTTDELRHLWYADLYRYGSPTPRAFVRALAAEPGYRYAFVMRLVAYARSHEDAAHRILALAGRVWLRRLRFRFGVDLPASCWARGPAACHASLKELRPETFGAHHTARAAQVADPVVLRRTGMRRLGKRAGANSRSRSATSAAHAPGVRPGRAAAARRGQGRGAVGLR